MKKLCWILITVFALVMMRDSNRIYADGGGGIPLSQLAGKFSAETQGSITICFNSGFTATEACSTTGAVGAACNATDAGQNVTDNKGNSCTTTTNICNFPGDTSPIPATVTHAVVKVTSYDPATGMGDSSFNSYTGGKCVGSTFNSTGATLTTTGTLHFVASNGGNRQDSVVTSLTDPVGDTVGAFNLLGCGIRQ
jgi:hypothetical protein